MADCDCLCFRLKIFESLTQKKPCSPLLTQQHNPALGRDLPLARLMIAEAFPRRRIRSRFSRDKTRLETVETSWMSFKYLLTPPPPSKKAMHNTD